MVRDLVSISNVIGAKLVGVTFVRKDLLSLKLVQLEGGEGGARP